MSDSFPPDEFSGTARLFPLPNLVLFPHVAQPLHLFELRYRQLMADALADDRLITMALLRPGWEEDYHNSPPIHPVVCVGQITQEERLTDGRYNLVLQGLSRARIVEELTTDRLYRVATVELLDEEPADESEEPRLRQELSDRVLPFFSAHPPALDQLRRLVTSEIPLSGLCDVFCFALPLETGCKQELLEVTEVSARVRLLLQRLEGRAAPTAPPSVRSFPPTFSQN